MNITDFLELYTGRNLLSHEKMLIEALDKKVKNGEGFLVMPRRNLYFKFPLILNIDEHQGAKE